MKKNSVSKKMKLQYIIPFTLALMSLVSKNMQQPLVVIELIEKKQSKHFKIPLNVASESRTIIEKYGRLQYSRQKKSNQSTPLLKLPNVTENGLRLFVSTVFLPETTFKYVWGKLLPHQRKELIKVTGETALNCPGITAQLVQMLFPLDLIQKIVAYIKQSDMQHELECSVVKHNMSHQKTTPYLSSLKRTMHTQLNGPAYELPEEFLPNTSPLPLPSNPMVIFNKKEYRALSWVQTPNYTYTLTLDHYYPNKFILWKTKEQQSYGVTHTLQAIIKSALFSHDGNYVAITTNSIAHNLFILTVDQTTDEGNIAKTFTLSYQHLKFNNSSTAFVALSCGQTNNNALMTLYDIIKQTHHTYSCRGTYYSLITFNHNDTRMILQLRDKHVNTIQLWDISDPSHAKQLKTFSLNAVKAQGIKYHHDNKTCALYLDNGNILLVTEELATIRGFLLLNTSYPTRADAPSSALVPLRPEIEILYNPELSSFNPQQQSQEKVEKHDLLFSSDGNLIITTKMNNYDNDTSETVTIWHTHLKRMICAKQIIRSKKGYLQINLYSRKDGGAILTYDEPFWNVSLLYTPEEKKTIEWVGNNNNIFLVYLLQRMYRAQQNNDTIFLSAHEYMKNAIEAFQPLYRPIIKKYLTH